MLLAALVLVRKSLRDLDELVPKLYALGARHVDYGALPEHYPVVGEALIGAMAEVAGPAWTREYEVAWTEAVGVVAGVMIEGRRGGDPPGRLIQRRLSAAVGLVDPTRRLVLTELLARCQPDRPPLPRARGWVESAHMRGPPVGGLQ
jgi:hypothetical protein